jgi:hypothetical protein
MPNLGTFYQTPNLEDFQRLYSSHFGLKEKSHTSDRLDTQGKILAELPRLEED